MKYKEKFRSNVFGDAFLERKTFSEVLTSNADFKAMAQVRQECISTISKMKKQFTMIT